MFHRPHEVLPSHSTKQEIFWHILEEHTEFQQSVAFREQSRRVCTALHDLLRTTRFSLLHHCMNCDQTDSEQDGRPMILQPNGLNNLTATIVESLE
jgi:hypothetical protein